MRPKVRKIPEYGERFTMRQFELACRRYQFVDDDGTGYYANKTHMFEQVLPSQVSKNHHDNTYSHVAWFNK